MLKYVLTYRRSLRITVFAITIIGLIGSILLLIVDWGDLRGPLLLAPMPFVLVLIISATVCRQAAHGVHCDSCKWIAGLVDVEYHNGLCPICKGTRFSYAVPLAAAKKHNLLIGMTEYSYRYLVMLGKTLAELKSEKNLIWRNPPEGWWEAADKADSKT